MLTQSLFQDHCWICETKFNYAGGPADCVKNDHHVVPRNSGGTHGPQVSLCSSQHDALHEIAIRLEKNKPYYELLTRDPKQDAKLMWLATVVVNAKLATAGDPNKAVLVPLRLDGETNHKLTQLAKFWKVSKGNAIKHLISAEYRKAFPQKTR